VISCVGVRGSAGLGYWDHPRSRSPLVELERGTDKARDEKKTDEVDEKWLMNGCVYRPCVI